MSRQLLIMVTLLLHTLLYGVYAQEVTAKFKINSDKVAGANKQIFQTLEQQLTEFVNNRKWTNLEFGAAERINCTFAITITEMVTAQQFKADMQMQSSRPVYNAQYTTTVLNIMDKNFNFDYVENTPLEFVESNMDNPLTMLIAYYINLVLAVDFDTYQRYGGSVFYQQAQNIAIQGQSGSDGGWSVDDQRNRTGIINSFQDATIKSFRDLLYEYHRLGLDEMSVDVEKGRAKITAVLPLLKEVYKTRPMGSLPNIFIESKSDELVNVYSKAPMSEKQATYDLLMDIFPTYGNRLDPILNKPSN